ncbi:hypothetical protein COO60DRAFT_1507957 [Scenedesmus sp. NREL 46B-D3]|nr:hypothetical protein COO60DRAFT_1507957 [Scenedesmus sp. NREL 46B-D3]
MARKAPALLGVPLLLLCSWALGANAACCTSGQPSYEGSGFLGVIPIPTCSDGPCSGDGFSYTGEGAYESPNPQSCCDIENLGQFKYNPAAGSGKTWPWPTDENFPENQAGTGQPCHLEAVRFRCKLGGHETTDGAGACSADEAADGSCAAA